MDGISITVCILGASLILTGVTIKDMRAEIASLQRTNSSLWQQLQIVDSKASIALAKTNVLRSEIVNLASETGHTDTVRGDLCKEFARLQDKEYRLRTSFELHDYTDEFVARAMNEEEFLAKAMSKEKVTAGL